MYKIGDRIRIISINGIPRYSEKEGIITTVNGEPCYSGKEGTITSIDDMGQVHGSWGGLALIPGVDDFEIINLKEKTMLKMSFYDGTLNRDEAVKAILKADKPCKYTYGLKYRNPTTYEIPITIDEAIKIILNESLLDIREKDEYFDINAYSSNDMW